jgi:hypothetical protein
VEPPVVVPEEVAAPEVELKPEVPPLVLAPEVAPADELLVLVPGSPVAWKQHPAPSAASARTAECHLVRVRRILVV